MFDTRQLTICFSSVKEEIQGFFLKKIIPSFFFYFMPYLSDMGFTENLEMYMSIYHEHWRESPNFDFQLDHLLRPSWACF